MSNLILSLAKNSVDTVIHAPAIVRYSIQKSIKSYQAQAGGKISLYSKTLMVVDGLTKIPKYALMHSLGMDKHPLYRLFFETVYSLSDTLNPFKRLSATLHLLTPQGMYNAISGIFRFIDNCFLAPIKIFFKKIWNFMKISTQKLLHITTHIKKQQKFIMENNIINEGLIKSLWEGTKKFINATIGTFINLGFKIFGWVWKFFEPIIKKFYMPIASCFQQLINGMGLGGLNSLLNLWATGATKLAKTVGIGKNVSVFLQKKNIALSKAIGAIGNRFIHMFQVAGLGFVNTLFLKKFQTINSIMQYGELTNIVYNIYSFKKSMEDLAMGNIDF